MKTFLFALGLILVLGGVGQIEVNDNIPLGLLVAAIGLVLAAFSIPKE